MPGLETQERFTLFVTGADQGVIEPCGCSGGQLGGIGRRATLLEALTYGDQPRLIMSTGGLPGGTNALNIIRYEILLLCMDEMGYEAVALGPEELHLGRSAMNAVEAGYHKAFSAILDSNVTTLIAAAVLWHYGTGPIKGFAVTITIGHLASMFTAVFGTRVAFDWILRKGDVRRLSI